MSCDRLPSHRTALQGKIYLTFVDLNKNSVKKFSCKSACYFQSPALAQPLLYCTRSDVHSPEAD